MRKLFVVIAGLLAAGILDATPKYKSVEKLVATAGTRVALSSAKLMAAGVTIKARSTNAGLVYVGGVDVAAANGYHLAANAEVKLADVQGIGGANVLTDLAEIYIDAATNGDGVRVVYSYDNFKP